MATGKIDQQEEESLFGLEALFSGEEESDDPSAMSLIDHLEELRRRIFFALGTILVCGIVAFIFRDQILTLLQAPLPSRVNTLFSSAQHGKLIVTGLTEGFTISVMVSLAVGFVAALPMVLYQTWAFISPGLYENEKKYAVPFIFAGMILFALGVALAFFILRFPVEWLISFSAANFTELVTAGSYFTFVAFFMLAFGIVFELPLVLTFMAQVDLISSQTLRTKRPSFHVGMWIAGCFITPGADFYSPIILGVVMSALYELTILFIRYTKK